MRERKLEEILEECLAAYLEGRRTIDESLSLYPSLADRLEPILRTAATVSDSFAPVSPPTDAMEQGRRRFLARAAERRRHTVPSASDGLAWRRLTLLAGAGVLTAASLFAVAALAGRGSDENRLTVQFRLATPAPSQDAAVRTLRTRIDALAAQASAGRAIETRDLWSLTMLAARVGDPSLLDDESRREMEADLQALVQSVDEPSGGPDSVAQGVASLSEEMARLGVAVGGVPASGSPRPSPPGSATPGASPSPSTAPSASPGGGPTPIR